MENSKDNEHPKKRRIIKIAISLIALLAVIGFGYYWFFVKNIIFTDKASISAPLIDISSEKPGILKKLMVKEGDFIKPYSHIARINNDEIFSKTSGFIVNTQNEIGKFFNVGTPIVTIINPADLRVVAHVEETGGLSEIRVGQKVRFTVDAFDAKDYYGTVDEIAHTSDESAIAFNISDKRETKQFIVKIKYDVNAYPELLNGMSARVWIYKQ